MLGGGGGGGAQLVTTSYLHYFVCVWKGCSAKRMVKSAIIEVAMDLSIGLNNYTQIDIIRKIIFL